ncbi:MAG TPA: RNA polymerase sigma factor [Polyangia bacterium]|nr:RNA polymerase sigma factor [Polyangia bacterium]
MSRYADGDEKMFAVVYDAVAPRLDAYLRRNLRNQALVDDIVQQTFMQMHAKRGTFERGAQVLPWAFCIARNFMIDALRRSRHEGLAEIAPTDDATATWLVSAVAPADQIIEARETGQRILAVFAGLTAHQRAAFELTKGDGLSQSDAAQILGTTVMGIKQCVHKVYKKLQRALEDDDDGRERALPGAEQATSVGMERR